MAVLVLASRKSVMGAFTAARWVTVIGWIATAVMGLAAILMFVS